MREASAKHVDMYVASIQDRLRTALHEAQALSMAEAHRHKQYYGRKNRCSELETWQPGTSEGRCLEGERGRSRIGGKKETWEVLHQITANVPSYKVMNQHIRSQVLHQTDFFSLHQRLVFPCVWVAVLHGTGVPAPPHARLPL